MSSSWASALASLDHDLALLCDSLDKIEAARSIDVAEIVDQLKAVADSSGNLRALVLSELPEVSWQDRQELEVFLEEISRRVEAREIERKRSRLLALAAEIEGGTITHRRAARVTQLNRLREDAVEELRAHAAEKLPPAVPGPESHRWMEWACSLTEPDDTASLQALRDGFPFVDEFIANLEPGMWMFGEHVGGPELLPDEELSEEPIDNKDQEARRSRLLVLANELERGNIVHHRAARVTQLNQLRHEAIKELRFHASVGAMPPVLPGPEAAEWVQWACGLKEPEDGESLEAIRQGFSRLDEFVANLEADMWVPAGRAAVTPPSPPDKPADPGPGRQEPPRVEVQRLAVSKAEEPRVIPVAIAVEHPSTPVAIPAPARSAEAGRKTGAPALVSQITSRIKEFSQGKSRLFIAIGAVLLVGILGATQWTMHRTHASNGPIKPVDTKSSDLTQTAAASTTNPATVAAAAPATPNPADTHADKAAKPKDQSTPPPPQPERTANLLNNDSGLRTPTAMPKNKTEEVALVTEPPTLGSLPNGNSNSVLNIVKDVPVTQPKIAGGQKVRVSSGVAQGQLVHQVTPVYPDQARAQGVHGTVVLQAVIGKNGAVQSVKAVQGPPSLIPSAMAAVKQWRYKPFSLNGEPAEADIQINVNFAQ